MTDPDFDDTEFGSDFDAKDVSSILRDIDNANLALDDLDGKRLSSKSRIP